VILKLRARSHSGKRLLVSLLPTTTNLRRFEPTEVHGWSERDERRWRTCPSPHDVCVCRDRAGISPAVQLASQSQDQPVPRSCSAEFELAPSSKPRISVRRKKSGSSLGLRRRRTQVRRSESLASLSARLPTRYAARPVPTR